MVLPVGASGPVDLPAAEWSLDVVTDFGERVTHLYPNDCYLAHLSLYAWVVPRAAGCLVLDAGCGTGYGSYYLASHGARQVYGVDASTQAVQFCRQNFQHPQLEYRAMDLEQIGGLPEGEFDLVFSSNVLEHVPRVAEFLHGAWRLLRPTGMLVIAVPPIVDATSRRANLDNPYHLNLWSPRQWHHVLGMFFGQIECHAHQPRSGIEVDFDRAPHETQITEHDFVFPAVSLEELYQEPTLTAIFLAAGPRPLEMLPPPGAALPMIDASFTRPLNLSAWNRFWRLPGRAWRVAREHGLAELAGKARRYARRVANGRGR